MTKVFIAVLFVFAAMGCRVTEKTVTGTYRLKNSSRTKLVLKEDKTFEFVKNMEEPGPAFFPDSTEFNFRTSGQWSWENRMVVLNSNNTWPGPHAPAMDSISPDTEITSFSFRNQYGDPVSIRLIHFPANRVKLHKGNQVSFFAEDFMDADSITFHFYGYPPFSWIAGRGKRGNSQHRITLFEEPRPAFFQNHKLQATKKKLVNPDRSFSLFKVLD